MNTSWMSPSLAGLAMVATLGWAGAATAAAAAKLPFPAAPKGQTRWVIDMPAQADESLRRVEIIPGKMADVDCNHHFLDGRIERKTLEGWGYDYYIFTTAGRMASTMMGCPDNEKHSEFVAAPSLSVNYNSRLPLVIYTPDGYSVQYRLWQGAAQMKAAAQK